VLHHLRAKVVSELIWKIIFCGKFNVHSWESILTSERSLNINLKENRSSTSNQIFLSKYLLLLMENIISDGKHHIWWKTYDCMSHFFFNNISILQQNKKCNRWSDGKYDLIKTSFSIIQPSFCENILPTKFEFSLADWKTTILKTTLKIIWFRKLGETKCSEAI